MIEKRWCRRTVNNAVNRVRYLFSWAVEEELIPATNLEALKAVKGLKAGRTKARETPPVRPVPDQAVEATLPFLSPTVSAMVQLQRSTGARPGEICSMRSGDIDRSQPVWVYTPRSHKNSHRDQSRKIPIGPKGREILIPYLLPDPDAYCFSPARAERDRRQAMHEKRKTPLHYGNGPGTNRRRQPKRAPGECYSVNSYRAAITRACEEAFQPAPPLGQMEGESFRAWKRRLTPDQKQELRKFSAANRWHPHQLRHARATEVRREFGLEGAQAVLGHLCIKTTEIYVDRLDHAARQIAAATG
jgi:integrase